MFVEASTRDDVVHSSASGCAEPHAVSNYAFTSGNKILLIEIKINNKSNMNCLSFLDLQI